MLGNNFLHLSRFLHIDVFAINLTRDIVVLIDR